MKIRSIIVDDEESSRENLKLLLERHCSKVEVLTEAANNDEAQKAISLFKPDLAFLDIRLGKESIFELLERLPEIPFQIIFITAYDEYAVKAFQLNAVDYLLKPIDVKMLKQSIKRIESLSQLKISNPKMSNLVANLNRDKNEKRISLPQGEQIDFVPLSQIIRCQAEGNYTRFYLLDNKTKLVSKTLKNFELALEDNGFCRTHNSHIINLEKVKSFSRSDGGMLILTDDSRIPISRNRKDMVMSCLFSK